MRKRTTMEFVEQDVTKMKNISIWIINEMVQLILLVVPIKDLFLLNIVCKMWNDILSKNEFWRKKVVLEFPSFILLPKETSINWKRWAKSKLDFTNLKSNENISQIIIQCTKDDEIYRDFLIESCIIEKNEIVKCSNLFKGEFKVTNLELMSTRGELIPFAFQCILNIL